MTKNITSREWETLSAYLDGQLTQKERQRLEERLLHSVELRNGLDELRRTRQVLRSQPKMRAPRNFTLTPEMVGIKESRRSLLRIFPVMRLASVLASILLVLVVVGDLLSAPVYQTAQPDMARSGVEVTEVTAAEMPAMEAAELQVEAPKAEGAAEKALDPESTPTGEMMMMTAPTEEVQDLQAEPPAALTMPSGGGQPAEEFATAETELSLPTETPLPTVEPTPAPVEEPAPPAPPARPYWRAAEILLALIAISSGLVALYLRRSAAG